MVVRPINENDFDRRFPKGFGRSQTTKTAADDHYPRCPRRLLIRTIDRIEIGIVHPLFLKPLSAEISENLGFSGWRLGRGPNQLTELTTALVKRARD
jgi:hypothetical protein